MARKGFITKQAKRLSSGEINRRRFVMHALSAGVTMPTAMSLASKAEANPRKGGTLRQATGGDLRQAAAFIHGSALTEHTPDGLRGELATEYHSDGRTWVFRLREDVTFHDATPFDANDVLATFRHLRQTRPTDPVLCNIRDLRAAGPIVTFDLIAENADFARHLAAPRFVIRPSHDPDGWLGTGPFIADGAHSHTLHFTRNPDYWKDQRPHFDAVELTALPDHLQRQNALVNGEIDFADQIDVRSLALIQRMPNLATVEQNAILPLGLHLREDDPALIQTLDSLLPRQALVDKVLLGHGIAATSGAQRTHDPLRPLTLHASPDDFSGAPDMARLIVAACQSAGLDIDLTDNRDTADMTTAVVSEDARHICAVHANAISAHSEALHHAYAQHDPLRVAERWWFA